MKQKQTFSWEAPDNIQMKRGVIWYAAMLLAYSGALFFAIREGSWSFAVALLVSLGVYQLIESGKPKKLPVTLSKHGIAIGGKKFTFSELKYFWVFETSPDIHVLHLRTVHRLMPDFQIALMDNEPEDIRAFLRGKVTERANASESLPDLLVRLLKL